MNSNRCGLRPTLAFVTLIELYCELWYSLCNFIEAFLDRFDGGESMMQLCQRVYNLIDDIRAEDRTYLLVAHNGIACMVHSYFHDMTNEEYAALQNRR